MSAALTIDGRPIRREGSAPHERWCLTDLWTAAGKPKLRPAEWLRKEGATFVEFIAASLDMADGHIRKSKPNPSAGDPGSLWAHWQIALAYAKALSPAFHARVNEVYRAYTAGLLTPREVAAEQELVRLSLLTRAFTAGPRRAWDLELKLELARLRRVDWDGRGAEPKGLAFAYGRTWRVILGDAVYEEMKRRNPEPRDGTLHGQWLQEQRFSVVKDSDMVIALVLARRCTRWTEYENEMRAHFRRTPIQLRLVTGTKGKA
jgi:hypothetical protein